MLLVTDLAMTSLIAGEPVLVALFDPGIDSWVRDGDNIGKGQRTLGNMLGRCRELATSTASFSVLACGGAVERSALDLDALLDGDVVDDVVGLPTIWRRAAQMRLITL